MLASFAGVSQTPTCGFFWISGQQESNIASAPGAPADTRASTMPWA